MYSLNDYLISELMINSYRLFTKNTQHCSYEKPSFESVVGQIVKETPKHYRLLFLLPLASSCKWKGSLYY